ncbi:MAG: DUF4172 domain-containing protein [Betaproteobacteria bacterium]|nr:DUF4172 domain-containing protein [Betaproteobacteria bacterium]
MQWNWQQPGWPEFSWKQSRLQKAEALFLLEAGEFAGTAKHLGAATSNSQPAPPLAATASDRESAADHAARAATLKPNASAINS